MKNDTYELTLLVRDPINETKFLSRDTVVSNDMVHLLSQFLLVITRVMKSEQERIAMHSHDDDIPF